MTPKLFDSLEAFAVHLIGAAVALEAVEHRALKKAALLIESEAKKEMGHYQSEVGPFPAWAPLAASTEARKASLGQPANAPLIATGAAQRNITHQIDGDDAAIGSPDDYMVFHEFGTDKMPPRPVFGPAVYKNLEKLHFLIGAEVVGGLIGGSDTSGGADYFIGSS